MRPSKKSFPYFAFALIIYIAPFLHAEEGWKRVSQTKELYWGADTAGGAPYVFQNPQKPDELIGFELDITNALAGRLGVKSKLIDVQWDQLVPALLRNDYDIAFNGLEITPERAKTIDFSDPYYLFSEAVTIRRGDNRFHKFSDLYGHRVGTLSAALAQKIMEQDGHFLIVDYPDPVSSYKDLEIGRIDAVLLDVPIAAYYAGPNQKLSNTCCDAVGEGLYAGGLRKDSPQLKVKVNQALKELWASGEMERIYKKWSIWTPGQNKLLNDLSSLKDSAQAHIPLWRFLPLLLKGAGITVTISCLAMILAVLIGFSLCIGKLYGNGIIRTISSAYIEVIRGTPLLIQLYILYYGLPNLGIELNAFVAAVLGMGMNYAAYEVEIYRAGLLSIPKGQEEAARSIGMTGRQSLFHIILPQAIRTIIPPSTNDFIALFKDSSLVSIITVVELTKMYNQMATSTYRFLELGLVTAFLYFVMSYPLSLWSRHLEEKQRHAMVY